MVFKFEYFDVLYSLKWGANATSAKPGAHVQFEKSTARLILAAVGVQCLAAADF
jgi:hypothetical protein